MVDVGCSGASNVTSVSRNSAAFCRLHRTRSEPRANRTRRHRRSGRGAKYSEVTYEDQAVRISGEDAGRDLMQRCHHDRIF